MLQKVSLSFKQRAQNQCAGCVMKINSTMESIETEEEDEEEEEGPASRVPHSARLAPHQEQCSEKLVCLEAIETTNPQQSQPLEVHYRNRIAVDPKDDVDDDVCRNTLVTRVITALLGVLAMAATAAGVAVIIVTIEFEIKFAIHNMVSAPIVDTFKGTCNQFLTTASSDKRTSTDIFMSTPTLQPN